MNIHRPSLLGNTTVSGSVIPETTNLYDLGSPTKQFKDLYLSSASLYIDGTKVISSTTDVLTFTTDTGQSLKFLEAGADDITLQTENGNIELKGTVEILTSKKIIDSAGTSIQFGDSLGITGSIELTGTVDGVDLLTLSSSYTSFSASVVAGGIGSYSQSFSTVTAVTASHNLGTKNVTVAVYDNSDFLFSPVSIKTHDSNNVYVQFATSRTGRIVITQ